jgi:hypothetical protein
MPSQLLPLPHNRRLRLEFAPAHRVPDQLAVSDRALPGLDAARGGHDGHWLSRLDPLGERGCRKPAEYHGVDRAQPVDSQHREQRRRYHRHVYQYHVTFSHAILPQHSCQDLDFVEEVCVAEFLSLACDWALPDDCRGFSISRLHVSVDAVVACRDLAIWKPGPGFVAGSILEGFRAHF